VLLRRKHSHAASETKSLLLIMSSSGTRARLRRPLLGPCERLPSAGGDAPSPKEELSWHRSSRAGTPASIVAADGGDRDANRALRPIAVCRFAPPTPHPPYPKRRTAEAKTKPELIRCPKRHIMRETYNTPTADLASPRHQRRTARTTTIHRGARPIAITRRRT
jgi:hypothetical protein